MPRYPKPKGALPARESCGAGSKPGCTKRAKRAKPKFGKRRDLFKERYY